MAQFLRTEVLTPGQAEAKFKNLRGSLYKDEGAGSKVYHLATPKLYVRCTRRGQMWQWDYYRGCPCSG